MTLVLQPGYAATSGIFVTETVSKDLAAFDANQRRFMRATLLAMGRRVRARMTREQLSFGYNPNFPRSKQKLKFGVHRITGKLIRSLRAQLLRERGPHHTFVAHLGGLRAPYWWLEEFERKGRLAFARVVRQEFQLAVEEIRIGLEFLARSPATMVSVPVETTDGSIEGFSAEHVEIRNLIARRKARLQVAKALRRRRRGAA